MIRKMNLLLCSLMLCSMLLVNCKGVAESATPPAEPLPDTIYPTFEALSRDEGDEPEQTVIPATATQNATVISRARNLYDIQVTLYESEHRIDVVEKVTFQNQSNISQEELPLVVEALHYPESSFEVRSIKESDVKEINYRLENSVLWVDLSQSLDTGDWVSLEIQYSLTLGPLLNIFGFSDRLQCFTNWYPYLPPWDGEWLIYSPSLYGEHLSYPSSDYRVEIGFGEGLPVGTLVAPARASWSPSGATYVLEGARTFSWAVLYNSFALKETVGDIEITVYVPPKYQSEGEDALDYLKEGLEVFQEILGPYPYKSLSLVTLDYFDGMEYDGLFFLGTNYFESYNGTPASYLAMLSVHEAAHNWWFGEVGNNQAMEPWLDEALCISMEWFYYEHKHPELVDWWWDYRVNGFYPDGKIDVSIYTFYDYEDYRQAVYLQGAKFIRDLRKVMGDEDFFNFLRTYLENYRYQIPTGEDFWRLAEQFSEEDLSGIKDTYFSK
ncbi:MAG: hypothetical protein JXA19_02705 [Anaerolineales bacterium]|nr:hypothetical protein [Anaerolineales bacterium]